MKAYSLDLRTRIVEFIQSGGTKTDAARRFKVVRQTVHRYLNAQKKGCLAPKPQPGRKKTFKDETLRKAVKKHPDATLAEHGKSLGVTHAAVWKRLRQLALTLKKSRALP